MMGALRQSAPADFRSGRVASGLDRAVQALLADVGQRVIMPRFRNLLAHEVTEKSRGELVTVVDQEAEELLHHGLERLDPGSFAIGEEACASQPALVDRLTSGRAWVIDPLDGTANFAAGRGPFGIIVALLVDGVTEAGWLYDPVAGRCCHAWRGEGAFVDGRRLRTAPSGRRPVAALATQFLSSDSRERLHAEAAQAFELVPIPRSAAEHYPRLALGQNDLAVFQRTLPWDHAAGALLLMEAGGYVTRWNGSPYRIGDDGVGLIAAADQETWARAIDVLGPTLSGIGRADLVAQSL